jgi:hypothetical protein
VYDISSHSKLDVKLTSFVALLRRLLTLAVLLDLTSDVRQHLITDKWDIYSHLFRYKSTASL